MLDAGQQHLAGAPDHVRHLHRPGGRLAGVEHLHPARGAVHQVHHVIQPRREQVDVFPIEGGDEGSVQPGHYLVGYLVGLVLQPLDGIHDRAAPVRRRYHQVMQQLGCINVELGDGTEQVEELLVARQEAHCHVRVTGRRRENTARGRWGKSGENVTLSAAKGPGLVMAASLRSA